MTTKLLIRWASEVIEEEHGPPWQVIAEDVLALAARANQLEKALREIADYMPSMTTSDPLAMTAVLSDVREIAVAALAGVPAEPAAEEKP